MSIDEDHDDGREPEPPRLESTPRSRYLREWAGARERRVRRARRVTGAAAIALAILLVCYATATREPSLQGVPSGSDRRAASDAAPFDGPTAPRPDGLAAVSARWDRLAEPKDESLDAEAIARRIAGADGALPSAMLELFERTRGEEPFRAAVDRWIQGAPELGHDEELRALLLAAAHPGDAESRVDLLRRLEAEPREIQYVASGVVLESLLHADANVRQSALRTLSRILSAGEAPPQFDRLLEAFLRDGGRIEKERVLQIVAARRMVAFVPRLAELLDDPDARIAMTAATAIGRVGDPGAIEPLRRIVFAVEADPSRAMVRAEAAISLDGLGDAAARAVVLEIATSKVDRSAASVAFQYLVRRAEEDALPLAAALARDPEATPQQVQSACKLLGDRRQPVTRAELVHLLESPHWNNRVWARYALAAAGDRAALNELIDALHAGDEAMSIQAYRRIMQLDDPQATAEARRWLDAQPEQVQRHLPGG